MAERPFLAIFDDHCSRSMNLSENFLDIVAVLQEKKIISKDLASSMQQGSLHLNPSTALISAIRKAIKEDGKVLQIFASILYNIPYYKHDGERMLKDYNNEVVKELLSDEKHGEFELIKSNLMHPHHIYR